MNEDVKELFRNIQTWMLENDCECGSIGSEIYNEITEILNKYE